MDGQLPVGTSADVVAPLTLALSADGDIVLASSEPPMGGQLALSVQSTSVVLVRIALHHSHLNSTAVNQAITQSAAFGQLQSAVQFALDQGYAPATQSAVFTAVGQVVDSLESRYKTAAASPSRKTAAALPPYPHVTRTPQTILDEGNFLGTLEFDGVNNTRLAWSVKEGDISDTGPELFLQPKAPHTAGRNWGKPHLFKVAQTEATAKQAAGEVVRQAALTALAGLGVPTLELNCAEKVAVSASGVVLNSPPFLPILRGIGDSKAVDSYFKNLNVDVLTKIDAAALLHECIFRSPGAVMQAVLKTWTGFQIANIAYDGITTYLQFKHYRGDKASFTFIICEDETLQVRNCATRFLVAEKKLLSPYAMFQPAYVAWKDGILGLGGAPTGRAAGLKFTLAATSMVAGWNGDTGAVTALLPGDIVMNVLEPETGVSSDVAVATVVIPRLVSDKVTIAIGETVSLRFVDPSTLQPIIWTGFDQGMAVAFDQSGAGGVQRLPQPIGAAAASFVATRAGDVDIDALFGVAGRTQPVRVTVKPAGNFWDGSFETLGCTPGGLGGCALALNPPNGGGRTGRLLAAIGLPGETLNFRRDHNGGRPLCMGHTVALEGNTFSLPVDLTGVFLPGPQTVNMVFAVTSRTADRISGTWSQDFTDVVEPLWTPKPASAWGTWSMAPRSTSFPKCTNQPPGGIYCTVDGQSLGPHNFVGTCDWRGPDSPGRAGEWQIP